MELERAIAESLRTWAVPYVEEAVFGTVEPRSIAAAIDTFCQRELGARVQSCLLWGASVGVSVGVELEDRRRLFIKCHQPDVPIRHLRAVHQLRRHLLAREFPTPEPVLEPRPLGLGLATVEAFAEADPPPDGFDPAVRSTLAEGLVRLIELSVGAASDLNAPTITNPPGAALWPRPHSRLFDFEATAGGAMWIDALARSAKAILASEGRFGAAVGHRDWRVEHVRLKHGRIAVVYDWESVVSDTWPGLVGWAAAHWAANWQTGFSGRRTPTPEESDAFVADCERARGSPFTALERRHIGASRLYALAYAARCGHHPDRPPIPGAAEEVLKRYGDQFLKVVA